MDSIRNIKTLELSKYINSFRELLIGKGFFEHSLYSTTDHKIENTPYFKLTDGLFLRYGTEPDVWEIGQDFDKFFWIGSLFRNEKNLTEIHNYEFKVLDYYIKNGSMDDVPGIFCQLLKKAEENIQLKRKLSKFNFQHISYKDLVKDKLKKIQRCWLIVTDYPKEESFYDCSPDIELTTKFEIFFYNKDKLIELASGGLVGRNINSYMYIKNENDFVNKKVFDRRFMGLGFGLERLIYLYFMR